jgi:hypothetical protein
MVLDIFALVVIVVMIAAAIAIVVKVGPMPGNIAKERGHPQADAIAVLGWIGIVTLGLAWPVALVWAYMRSSDMQSAHLAEQIVSLETELAALKATGGDA